MNITRRYALKSIGLSTSLLGAGLASGEESGGAVSRYLIGLEQSASVDVASVATQFDTELDFGTTGRLAIADLSESTAETVAARSDVRYVEPDGVVHTLEIEPEDGLDLDASDTAAEDVPWGVDRVDAKETSLDGEGATIAIIDTGIDPNHEGLADNIVGGKAFVECSGGCDEPWADDNKHGTHCAGIAAAVSNDLGKLGVAPEANL